MSCHHPKIDATNEYPSYFLSSPSATSVTSLVVLLLLFLSLSLSHTHTFKITSSKRFWLCQKNYPFLCYWGWILWSSMDYLEVILWFHFEVNSFLQKCHPFLPLSLWLWNLSPSSLYPSYLDHCSFSTCSLFTRILPCYSHKY